MNLKNILSGFPLKVKYKRRIPDPGECTVVSVNWEKRQMEVSNGSIRLFPNFDQVDVVSFYVPKL